MKAKEKIKLSLMRILFKKIVLAMVKVIAQVKNKMIRSI